MRWPGGKLLKAESMVLRILEQSQEATMIGAESVKGRDDMTEGTVYSIESPRDLLGKISWRLSATKLMIKITNSVFLSSIAGARLCLQWGQCKAKI